MLELHDQAKEAGVVALIGCGGEQVTFPVLGECEAYYVGHPEPVTIPRSIKGLRNVTQKGGALGMDELMLVYRADRHRPTR